MLLFAPGGMRSAISFWENSPWNPIEAFRHQFMVIAMDQRYAGQSVAPVAATDSWNTFTADHLALLDYLGIDRCHVMGGCIGGPYCFGLMKMAPDRVAAAIIQQTIGLDDNRNAFYDMFNGWADEIAPVHPEANDATWSRFRENMYGGEFLFNVDREFVQSCQIPMLVLLGSDLYHPESISRELADLAPDSRLVEDWKSAPTQTANLARAFLEQHTHT